MLKKILSILIILIFPAKELFAADIPIIVIAPSKKAQSVSTVGTSVTVLDETFFQNSNELFLGDALATNSTSVNFFQNGGQGQTSAIQLRGLPKRYSTVYIDGVKMSDPASVSNDYDFNHLLTSQIARVEILKGNQSSVYGSGAIGGTINITTKKGEPGFQKNIQYNNASHGTNNLSLSLSGADDNDDFYVGLERFQTEGISAMDARELLVARPRESHKGDYGRVLIIGGCRGMAGAVALAGQAALRSGAGLVRLAVPDGILDVVASHHTCYLTEPLPSDTVGRIDRSAIDQILAAAEWADVVAIGPGLGQSDGLLEIVTHLFHHVRKPLVADADALNLLAGLESVCYSGAMPRVLTPHAGEYQRLAVEIQPETFADSNNVILVLKGPGTIVTDGQQEYVNTTGNPGMATGGSGDVLTGMIAAFIGQIGSESKQALQAAKLGVYLHGLQLTHRMQLLDPIH